MGEVRISLVEDDNLTGADAGAEFALLIPAEWQGKPAFPSPFLDYLSHTP
jgi:hypothetical protein